MSDKPYKPKRPKKPVKAAPRATVPPRVAAPVFTRPVAAASPKKAGSKTWKSERGELVAKVSANGAEGELTIFGTIGFDWFGEGITAGQIDEAVKLLGGVSTIRLRINSGGGDVFEATQIYNILVKHSANVIVEIEGVAASAATLISMAGDEIRISENAHWMIHRASGGVWGNDDDVASYLQLLRNANELLRLTYSRRTGISDEELVEMMRTDNWMTAQKALELGFVDALDEAKSVEPHVEPGVQTEEPPSQRISSERLAAMADSLATMAATGQRVAASVTTGGSPQPVLSTHKDQKKMNAKLRELCIKAGMPETLTGDAADKWLDDNFEKAVTQKQAEPSVPAPIAPAVSGGLTAKEVLDLLDAREEHKTKVLATWKKEVDANLELAFPASFGIDAEFRQTCYAKQIEGIDAVRTAILEHKKKLDDAAPIGGPRISFSQSQPRDRHLAAIRAGVLVRAMSNFDVPGPRLMKVDGVWQRIEITAADLLEKHLPMASRPKDWESFAHMPLIKIAEECLLVDGFSVEQIRRMPGPTIAMCAMGYFRGSGVNAAALHTTGSLLEITRDAVNKSLTAGYEEAPQTWRGPFRQGTSVPDFKDIHRVKLSAAGNLPVWVDNLPPELAKLSNEKEKYAVQARAETLSFSWQLLINDDMNALSRYPQLLGDAAGRTVNAVAWQQLTSNPTMVDGQALFLATPSGNRFRSNLTTGAATPTNTTIGAMRAKMRLMRGVNSTDGGGNQIESEDILNLSPTYIMGGAALEEGILKQVLSGADPASGGNSAVYNTSRSLTPVIEPLLDAASTTAWYLAATPNRVDTVEVTFLQGQETPYPHEWMDDETMCQNYTIMQTFNAKALDHRGLQKHNGA